MTATNVFEALDDQTVEEIRAAAELLVVIAEKGVEQGHTSPEVPAWLDKLGSRMHLVQLLRSSSMKLVH